ncbi:MAG: FAD-dependent 5-carboxymethylaminomethyl-2-thiouridine(34) oxidoreductase MnmC [Alphaproteobacteria bacterium]|nr:FAD-dependent 5-carboxymethylaminomethyl-2-thiouridine(34) oxidoreductase MnmC [Alphaproteobacteria bacterium]
MSPWPRLPRPALNLADPRGPRSDLFADGYASKAGAVAEGEAVFLRGIGAPDIWTRKTHFALAETGFGLGLNFLLTWRLWRETAPPDATLDYVSVEGFPVDAAELAQAHALYPELQDLSAALIALYPPRHQGAHPLSFDHGRVRLTLLFGPGEEMLADWSAGDGVDAWYLDGFAPSRNPDFWTESLFRRIAALSTPGAVAATYTAAGAVKRGLQAAGFEVRKAPGFADKRERLLARLSEKPPQTSSGAPWSDPPASNRPTRIAVIGGGVAGLCLADALRRHGAEPSLFSLAPDLGSPLGGVAMLAPRLPAAATPGGRLQAAALLYATRFYDALQEDEPVWLEPRGVACAPPDGKDAARHEALVYALSWPTSFLTRDERGFLLYPRAGAVKTDAVQSALRTRSRLTPRVGRITDWRRGADGTWRLIGQDGQQCWDGDAVVFAAGAWTGHLLRAPWLEIRPARGQVSRVAADPSGPDHGALSYDGYASPILSASSPTRIIGSSFSPWPDLQDEVWRGWRDAEHAAYAQNYAEASGLDQAPEPIDPANLGWVGLRATTPDRLPIVGGLPDAEAYRTAYAGLRQGRHWEDYPPAPYQTGLSVLTGLGARGYLTAPLLAEVLARQMLGLPQVLEDDVIAALHPGRFLIRALKRGASASD